MDATHPNHNPVAGYGSIKRGHAHEIRSNTGRQRLNINGVIDGSNLSAIIRYDDTINAQATIKLLQQIEAQNPQAGRIQIICDNARYYRSRQVKAYLATSTIELVFLPPYAPNLNLIERFWKFFKKTCSMAVITKPLLSSKPLAATSSTAWSNIMTLCVRY